jgi:hypothetical protein
MNEGNRKPFSAFQVRTGPLQEPRTTAMSTLTPAEPSDLKLLKIFIMKDQNE